MTASAALGVESSVARSGAYALSVVSDGTQRWFSSNPIAATSAFYARFCLRPHALSNNIALNTLAIADFQNATPPPYLMWT
jgi:hypothetical protein